MAWLDGGVAVVVVIDLDGVENVCVHVKMVRRREGSQRQEMRCKWVKEYLRKGIACIGREGRTLSPFRGGSGGG